MPLPNTIIVYTFMMVTLKDHLSREKPWAILGMTRKQYAAARPWKKAGMTKEKYAEMLNLVPRETNKSGGVSCFP